MTRYVHTDRLLLVVGRHPHEGEHCHPIGETKDSVTCNTTGDSWFVELIDCKHGIKECFISKKYLNDDSG